MAKVVAEKTSQATKSKESRKNYIKNNFILYLFLVPAVVLVFIFNYIPMYGVTIAFKDFSPIEGIMGSEWIGFDHFINFLQSPNFQQIFMNTIKLSAFELLIGFPIPVILALMLNQLRRAKVKKNIQLIIYAPYFLSTVVISGMLFIFLSPAGPINEFLTLFMDEPVAFMTDPSYFRSVFIASSVWQVAGFSSIIYVAALSNVDPQLHDAATIDGASLLQRIIHIDLQVLKPTMAVLFILAIGGIMGVGFEKAYLLQTDMNLPASEIIDTYVYKRGLQAGDWSFGAAVGLFNSVISLLLLVVANTVIKKINGETLY
ncbi:MULTISPECIES: sugar ABC transporter permease [unclassified Planococcus (in: firmicutes)]|uniref:ABC transporter permease n=1 Tax=unclassified Planococcus (in: firmicutes) TaxID=2662419 RepID=UPI000C3412AA|nr:MULTISPECIES: ABC transporter permease subunit [unclassified Planococcus (in: firmicutes)]AUD15374.1 ABC transporter permease [Planococcus sp. MB-3u-03]PKG45115.1 ABC transporter permease [Planococcus sp. Urea-trap-24]PKG87913.1 ABC transporter permease [Planococcus sp. Urea-3u-39]PKH42664.1 ABC transporter permease [Planococcus sp. MB-3u-09]